MKVRVLFRGVTDLVDDTLTLRVQLYHERRRVVFVCLDCTFFDALVTRMRCQSRTQRYRQLLIFSIKKTKSTAFLLQLSISVSLR